jgi:hypothetical protein
VRSRVLALGVLTAPAVAAACSGPQAFETLLFNERVGMGTWLLTLLFALAFVVLVKRRRTRWVMLGAPVLHPGWWMSARGGDCGYTLFDSSLLFTGITLAAGAFLIWRVRRTPLS